MESSKPIKPLTKKVEAIYQLATPKTKSQLHSSIGMINYYKNMWRGSFDVLAS